MKRNTAACEYKFPCKACSSSAAMKCILLIAFLASIQITAFSQTDSTHTGQPVSDSLEIKFDSAKTRLFDRIKQFGASEQARYRLRYSEDSISTKQEVIIELIKRLTLEAQTYVDKGIDTTGLTGELNNIKHWYDITADGVFINKGSMQSYRNLETSYKIVRELLIRVVARKSALDQYYKKLVSYRNTIDSLYKEDVLYSFSSDSVLLGHYVEKLTMVSQEIKPIDSALKKTLLSVSELQPPVNMLVNKLNASIEQMQVFQRELSSKTLSRESNNLWHPAKYTRPFQEILNISMIKGGLSFVFFVRNEVNKIILMFFLVAVCTRFILNLKRHLRRHGQLQTSSREQSILQYPFLSSLFIVLSVFQFVFIDPPFLFSAMIWFICGVALTFILKNIVARYWLISWLIIFVLFILACLDNMVLQLSRPERWIMLCLSATGIITCSTIVLKGFKTDLKEKLLLYFVMLLVVLQIVSILANLYGRLNLARIFFIAGFFNVVLIILFFWAVHFIGQALAISARVYDRPNKKLFNRDFERRKERRSFLYYFLLFVGWFVLFGRNFYAFRFISEPVKDFFIEKRTIGEFSFTIGNVFGFFLILYLSGMISRMVSFFASDASSEPDSTAKSGGFSSSVLIIRICIITIGVLAAFAAIGVPMDRLTIIFSALSVGIGFGLQSLVNNLVSGLIISVEKPVSVGDIVEIGGQSGTVKSIGFRSSIISTVNGAKVVIPNGDLLNLHLVNWTHESSSRSVDIKVCVVQGTKLEKAIKILKELPAEDERTLKEPAPKVLVRQFSGSAIELQLTFWVKNLVEASQIKSDLLLAIDSMFRQNSIMIAAPKQEIAAAQA